MSLVIAMNSGFVSKLALAILLLSLGSVFLSGQSVQVAASPSSTPSYYGGYWYHNSTYSCYYGYYYSYSYYCYYYYGYPYYYSNYYGYPYYYDYYYYDYSYYNTPAKYSLTVSTDPSDLGSVSGGGTYTQGTTASFSITKSVIQSTSNTRYMFSHWSGDYSGVGNSGSITMNGAHNIVAVYQLQYYLSVQSQGAPLPQGEGWYNSGDSATLTAAGPILGGDDTSRLVFQGWSADGKSVQSGITLNLKMDGPHSVSPVYQRQYYLKVLTDQGVTYGQGWYDEGATAQVYASTPVSTTYGVSILFNGWQGDVQSNSQSTSVVMDKPKTVIASWRTDPTILNLTIALGIIAAFLAAAGIIVYVAVSRSRYRQQAVPLVPKKATDQTTTETQPVKKRSTPPKKKPLPDTENANPTPS